MFCAVMALIFQHIPCTKSIHRLRKKFKENRSRSGGNQSTGLASPKFIQTLDNFVKQGGHSPRNKLDVDHFGSLASKVGGKGRQLSFNKNRPLSPNLSKLK